LKLNTAVTKLTQTGGWTLTGAKTDMSRRKTPNIQHSTFNSQFATRT